MIIFGTRGYLRMLAIVTFVCQNCHNPAAQRVINRVTKFTLFFIPLFPVASSYATTCTYCGASTKIDKATAERYLSMAQQPVAPVGPEREQIPGGFPATGPTPQQYGTPGQCGTPGQYGVPQKPPASPAQWPVPPQPPQN